MAYSEEAYKRIQRENYQEISALKKFIDHKNLGSEFREWKEEQEREAFAEVVKQKRQVFEKQYVPKEKSEFDVLSFENRVFLDFLSENKLDEKWENYAQKIPKKDYPLLRDRNGFILDNAQYISALSEVSDINRNYDNFLFDNNLKEKFKAFLAEKLAIQAEREKEEEFQTFLQKSLS